MQECIYFEVRIENKLCSFISLYHSPRQSEDDFNTFINNIESNLDSVVNNHFLIILGDFKAKSNLWYNNNTTTHESSKIDDVNSQFGLQKLSRNPHAPLMTPCIHPNCHNILFAIFNFKMPCLLPYEREIWHYQKPNVDLIRLAINEIP